MNWSRKYKRDPSKVNYIAVMAGAYIVYVAVRMFQRFFEGSTRDPAVNLLGGLIFGAVGIGLIVQEWRVYRGLQRSQEPRKEPEAPAADPVSDEDEAEGAE